MPRGELADFWENQVRTRLPAGGNRIRTIGPAANGTAMGGPPKSILAISDLTLGGSTDRADVPIGNAQQSLLQQRDRWFESGSLQRRVRCEPDFGDESH